MLRKKSNIKIELKSKNFRSTRDLNKSKIEKLVTLFQEVKEIKNSISQDIHSNIDKLNDKNSLRDIFNNGYKKHSKNTFLLAWEVQKIYHTILDDYIQLTKKNINKVHLIEYENGNFIRKAIDGKSVCSKIIINQEKTYSHIYKFKVKSGNDIYIPLELNSKYHNQDFFYNKDHLVSFCKDKGLVVNMTFEDISSHRNLRDITSETLAGIDINIVSNLLAVSTKNHRFFMDIDRDKLHSEIQTIMRGIRHKKGTTLNHEANKSIKRIEAKIKRLISELLTKLKRLGIKDIVLENLNIKEIKSTSKSKVYGIKYSQLIRILKVSNIKNWIKVQGNNRGFRVHTTNPAYTSQQCSNCGCIVKKNRNKRSFTCNDCGYKEHADLNAANNIRGRLLLPNVLVNKLHKIEKGQYVPTNLNCGYLKEILLSDLNIGVSDEAKSPYCNLA